MGLRDIIIAGGQSPDAGGCWRAFGARNGSGSYTAPFSLEINGVTNSYSVLDVLPGGDNPNVTDWLCDFEEYAFLYGCTESNAQCLCPSGLCPGSTLYVFDSTGCCCTFPCDGDLRECTFAHDFGYTISVPTSDTFRILSFFVDTTQYVSSPVFMDPPNIINIGGEQYNTAFADTINSIGVPNFLASYPTLAQIQSAQATASRIDLRNNIVRLQWPTCLSFQIIVEDDIGTVYIWTQNGYSGPNASSNYGFPNPIDCVDSNQC